MRPSLSSLVPWFCLATFLPPAGFATEPDQRPPGILGFHATARGRAAAPPDEKRLTVVCRERLHGPEVPEAYQGIWISFLGIEAGRVLLVAFTKEPIASPSEVVALRPRYSPLPTARVGPSGTLDWAYVYDRNGDGRVDYFVYLQNAHPVLPDPVPAGFPEAERVPGQEGRFRLGKDLLLAMIERGEMVFRHYADDDFDGRVEAAVVEEFDSERPMFVKGWIVYRASRPGGEPDEAWAFRGAIDERRRVLPRGPRGYLVPPGVPGQAPETAAALLARASERLGVVNAALGRCRLGAAALDRGDR